MKHKTLALVFGDSEIVVKKIKATQTGKDLLQAEKALSLALFKEWFPVAIEKKSNGAPDHLLGYSLSNSHSRGWVAIARNPKINIGIDLQVYSTKAVAVKSKFVSEGDVTALSDMSEIEFYTLLWSLKEAAYKWHENFIALKDIQVQTLRGNKAQIVLKLKDGTACVCHAHYLLTPEWVLSVVEK